MATWATFKMEGLEGLKEALAQLPHDVAKRVAVDALRRAAGPVIAAAKSSSAFKDRSGKTRESIGVWPMRRKRYGVEVSIGPKSPAAHLIEYGTQAHRIDAKPGSVLATANTILGKTIEHPGARPHPFFRPAWDQNVGRVFDNLRKAAWLAILDAAERLRKRSESGKLTSKEAERLLA